MISHDIKLVLFDMGGVLVELTSIASMWSGSKSQYDESQLWELWLKHPAVHQMDRGLISTHEFCDAWCTSWDIEHSRKDIQKIYESLVVGVIPGAHNLILNTKQNTMIGCLSNSNDCHWPLMNSFGLTEHMDHIFVSHQIGAAKPEEKIYQHVLNHVPFNGEQILFIDDNQINIEAAHSMGMKAEKAQGVEGASLILKTFNIIK